MNGLVSNNEKKVYSLLGLCRRGGNIGSGEFQTDRHIKTGLSCLVIVATDSSENTKKKFKDSASFYKVPYTEFGNKEELGKAIGYEFRACVSVNNQGLAKKIMDLLKEDNYTIC